MVGADYGKAGEEALVKGCLAGEPAAVEALVARYQNAVFAVALSRLGSREDAEDVAQESFVTAIRTLHTLRDSTRVGSWLCGIARHKALNWSMRWRRPGTVSWESAPEGTSPAEGSAGVAEVIAAAELRSAVRSAIAGLTPLQRDAVVLRYVGGYGLGEMARLLDVPIGTVKRRLHDARQRLKGELLAVVGDELRQSGPSDDLRDRIQEAMDEARAAGDLHATALRRSEDALALLGGLPEGRERTELEIQALHLKAQAVTFPIGGKKAISIEEQALSLLKGLGDKRRVAAHLNELGIRYANSGDVKRAAQAHQRALDLFGEVGDEAGQGISLMWLGHLHLYGMVAPVRAVDYVQRALPLLHQGGEWAYEAVCQADLRALQASGLATGADTSGLMVYDACCDVLKTDLNGVRFASQPGHGYTNMDRPSEGPLAIDILESAGRAGMLVGTRWRAGDTSRASAFSYTMRPLTLTTTVVADAETVTVAAGDFKRCLHVHLHIVPDPDDDGSEFNRKLNLGNCGDKHIWYARGVGLIRFTFDALDGVRADIQLANHHVAGDMDGYLPLAVGNKWEYQAMGFDGRYVQQRAYEVLAAHDDLRYLACWAYAFRKSQPTA